MSTTWKKPYRLQLRWPDDTAWHPAVAGTWNGTGLSDDDASIVDDVPEADRIIGDLRSLIAEDEYQEHPTQAEFRVIDDDGIVVWAWAAERE